MARGGRRPGAGRPKQGITKKVSLTLSEKEWTVLEKEETYAKAIKKLIAECENAKTSKKND